MSKFVGADNFLVCGCRQFLSLWLQIKKDWESWTLRQEKVEMGQGGWWWGGEEKSKMLTIFTQEGLSRLPSKPCFQKKSLSKTRGNKGEKIQRGNHSRAPIGGPSLRRPRPWTWTWSTSRPPIFHCDTLGFNLTFCWIRARQTCYEGGNLIGTDDDSTSQVLGFYQMFPSFSEKLFYL